MTANEDIEKNEKIEIRENEEKTASAVILLEHGWWENPSISLIFLISYNILFFLCYSDDDDDDNDIQYALVHAGMRIDLWV